MTNGFALSYKSIKSGSVKQRYNIRNNTWDIQKCVKQGLHLLELGLIAPVKEKEVLPFLGPLYTQ